MERGLLREQDYDAERAERIGSVGVSRRRLLRASGAVLGAVAVTRGLGPWPAFGYDTPIVKPIPEDLFIPRGTNAEMRWEAMRGHGYLTPVDRFFVRNHTATPEIDSATWRLRVHGTGVRRELSLSYDDLLRLPSVTVTRAVECAGNGRSLFGTQQGTPAAGTQWTLGAIGVASWTGVRLTDVLDRARLTRRAMDVMPVGLDDLAVRRPIPVEKALARDTLLVYGMNGDVLPPDHGFPVRLLVPGWIGVANVKWVGSIEVSETPLESQWNTTSYRLFGPDYPDAHHAGREERPRAALPGHRPSRPALAHRPLVVGGGADHQGRGRVRRLQALASRAARPRQRDAGLAAVVDPVAPAPRRAHDPGPRPRRPRQRAAHGGPVQRAGIPVRSGGRAPRIGRVGAPAGVWRQMTGRSCQRVVSSSCVNPSRAAARPGSRSCRS